MFKIMTGVFSFGGSRVYYLMEDENNISFGNDICFYKLHELLDHIKSGEFEITDWDWTHRLNHIKCIHNIEKLEEINYDLFNRRKGIQ